MNEIKVCEYPEGLHILAKEMDLPFPKDAIAEREQYISGLIGFVAGL